MREPGQHEVVEAKRGEEKEEKNDDSREAQGQEYGSRRTSMILSQRVLVNW